MRVQGAPGSQPETADPQRKHLLSLASGQGPPRCPLLPPLPLRTFLSVSSCPFQSQELRHLSWRAKARELP